MEKPSAVHSIPGLHGGFMSGSNKLDLAQTEEYLRGLSVDDKDTSFVFQTFDDDEGRKEKRKSLTTITSGSFKDVKSKLVLLNQSGAGVFVTVNQSRNGQRSAKDIVALRALFTDKDDGKIVRPPIGVSMSVASLRGQHSYFKLAPNQPVEKFKDAQKILSKFYESDPKVCDLPRVMRVPGFLHQKNPDNPFLVQLTVVSGDAYTIEDVLAAHAKSGDSPSDDERLGKFKKWAAQLPVEESATNRFGGRNNTVVVLVCEGLGRGILEDDLFTEVAAYCKRAGVNQSVGEEILSRHIKIHAEYPFTSNENAKQATSTYSLALSYLETRGLKTNDAILLRSWRENFYSFKGTHYALVRESDLQSDVVRFLQGRPDTKKQAGGRYSSEILKNLGGMGNIPADQELPFLISDPAKNLKNWVSLSNGIADLDAHAKADASFLKPHTHDYFTTVALPYAFDKKARAPEWHRFLKKMIPDKDIRLMLQEWFGYNLVHDTTQNKLLLMFGDGANGKSVICTVLAAMLGDENVSAVPLEAFNPTRTFPLATTRGKLANIAEEIGEMDKTAEGLLKQFTGGKKITVEEKNRTPFDMKPTARLTFATNVLPKFTDRTNGIWRRILLIPLNVKVEEKDQNKNLLDPDYWRNSGELPAIFNWAVEGLERLRQNGRFTISKQAQVEVDQYKKDSNPAAIFLEEHMKAKKGSSIPTSHLYQVYSMWCKQHGYYPLGMSHFSKEIPRQFESVKKTKNAVKLFDGTRGHIWIGADWIDRDSVLMSLAKGTETPVGRGRK